ncbi:MAG: hypothetical protein U0836_19425 [Pirellulales bacterium]
MGWRPLGQTLGKAWHEPPPRTGDAAVSSSASSPGGCGGERGPGPLLKGDNDRIGWA